MNTDEPSGVRQPASGHAYYALAAVFIVLTFSLVDRNILSILLIAIKDDFDASDSQMGFLTGMAFAVTNAIAGIPLARLADRGSRRTIIAVGLAVWSALTALQGFARSFSLLALARVGVGIGEASTGPAAHSMISDYFAPERRATAIAIYTMGGHFGVFIGYILGGWLNDMVGWRTTLIIIGLPGMLVALLVALTVREPARGQSENRVSDEAQAPLMEVVRYLWSRPTFRHLCAAAPLLVSAFYCLNIWGPAFLIRVHGLTTSEVGVRLGPIMGIGGAVGTLLGGFICDRLGARDPRNYLRIPGISALGMIPFLVLFLFSPQTDLALFALVPMVVLAATFIAPIYTVSIGLARLRMRAMSSAMIHLIISVVGAGVTPQLIGIFNDLLSVRFGEQAVRYSLLLVALTNAWGAAHIFLAARSLPADMAIAAADPV